MIGVYQIGYSLKWYPASSESENQVMLDLVLDKNSIPTQHWFSPPRMGPKDVKLKLKMVPWVVLWKGALAIGARIVAAMAIVASTVNSHYPNYVFHLLEGPNQFYN
jgi:hypothetical protein